MSVVVGYDRCRSLWNLVIDRTGSGGIWLEIRDCGNLLLPYSKQGRSFAENLETV